MGAVRERKSRCGTLLVVMVALGLLALPAAASAATRTLAWGTNGGNLLGNGYYSLGSSAPIVVPSLADLDSLAVGGSNAAAIRSDGEVVAWGMTADPEGPEYVGVPIRLGVSAVSVAAANGLVLAVQPDGSVLKALVDTNTKPQPVAGLAGVASVAAGASHYLALHKDGSVSSWGWNGDGQLGDGTTTRRDVPRKIPGLTGVAAIAAGGDQSMALMDDGTVKHWGGVPGSFDQDPVVDPTTVPRLEGITRISTTGGNVMALDGDGAVYTWGWNGYGQLCDGSRSTRTAPARIDGLAPAAAVAAGGGHSLILFTDGRLLACGDNRSGELGRPAPDWLADPTPVPGMSQVTTIAAAGGTSHAIQADSAPVGTIRLGTDPAGETDGTIEGSGVYCGAGWSCAGTYPVGATVTFTADAGRHSHLDAWTGICGGTGTCSHLVTGDGELMGRFVMNPAARVAPDTRRIGRDVFPRIGKVKLWVRAWGPSAGVTGTHLKCRLKRKSRRGTAGWKRFRRCDGWPVLLKGLKTGRYRMVVRAVNRFGYDHSPERIRFHIKRARRG